MVLMLASHAAGFRLGRVIALLLIPICYFGYVLATETLREQALIDENRAGAVLMEYTYQLMLDQVDGWSASNKQDVLLQKGPSLAATTGVAKEFGQLEMALKSPTADKLEKLQKAANLMMAVGSGTAMNDAGNRELNLLADAASSVLPRLMVNFNRLHEIAEATMLDKQEQTAKLPEIESTAAILEFLARELDNATLRARANGNDIKAYSSLLQQTSKFNFDATYFKLQLFDHTGDDAERLRNLESAILAQKSKWIAQFQRSWEGLNNRRQILTDLRQAELHYWEWRTLAIAFGAITLGLGTAVSMFRQTLRQLDQVENARKDANAARHDAEEGSRELAAMNDNLARMNQEVNQHLKLSLIHISEPTRPY